MATRLSREDPTEPLHVKIVVRGASFVCYSVEHVTVYIVEISRE